MNTIFKNPIWALFPFFVFILVFLGAGISASSGYPTWSKLLEPCAKLLNIEITDSTNLFKLSQYYANQYGIPELKKVINNNINILNKQNDLIAELTNFNFKTIWTTNFDTLVEKTLADKNILTNIISDEKNLPNTKCLNRIMTLSQVFRVTNVEF